MLNDKKRLLLPVKIFVYGATVFAALGVLFSGLLVLFVVPAPTVETAVELSGPLQHVSRPHPLHGDLSIVLQDGRRYYVNRANEAAHFQWQRLLEEAKPGEIVTLTVVRPLAWRFLGGGATPNSGPVAGVRTERAVYMDPAVAGSAWTAQQTAVRSMLMLLAALTALVLLSFVIRRA